MLKGLSRSQNFGAWFAAIPARLYLDRSLNGTDRDVYGVIGICLRSRAGSIEVSQPEIGEFLGLSARQVRRSLRRLVAAGAIKVRGQRGAPSVYGIDAPAHAEKVATEKAVEPTPTVKCPKCRKSCRGLLKVGWCRSCGWKNKVQRIVREEIARTEAA